MTSALTVMPGALAHLPQADAQAQLLALWLMDKSPHTQRAYRADASAFLSAVGGDLQAVNVRVLYEYAAQLAGSPATRARALSAIKSLLSFAHKVGFVPFNVGTAIKIPRAADGLAERILCEADVHKMINLAPRLRDQVLLRALYASGLRVSELSSLTWRAIIRRHAGAQLNVVGKGAKARSVLVSKATARELDKLRPEEPDAAAPVFRSQRGGALTPRGIRKVVAQAGERIGLEGISPHWLRHAHASHALDRGAPIHLVQATLGHTSVATTGRYLHARPQESSALHLGV